MAIHRKSLNKNTKFEIIVLINLIANHKNLLNG